MPRMKKVVPRVEDGKREKSKRRGKVKKHLNRFVPEYDGEGDEGCRITKKGKPIYDNTIHPHAAYMLCREHGFTNKQLARVFGVSYSTVKRWLSEFADFREKVNVGKDEFDAYHVEQMLLKRAMGFEYKERTTKKTSLRGRTDDKVNVLVPATEVTETIKYIPPDVKAAQFWLTNRNKERWQLVHKIQADVNKTESKTEVTANTADLAKMSVEQLKMLRELIATSATGEGAAIPVECVGGDGDAGEGNDSMKQIEYFLAQAEDVKEAEFEEVDDAELEVDE